MAIVLQRYYRSAICMLALGCLMAQLCLGGQSLAMAQGVNQVKNPDDVATIDLDVLSLLVSNQVFVQSTEDAIWRFTPGPGRQLVQLPLMVEPGDEPTEFSTSNVRLGSARFLAWRLVEPNTQTAEANSDAAREIESGLEDLPTFTRRFTLTPSGRVQWSMDRFILQGSIKPVNLAAGTGQRLYALKISPQTLNEARPEQPRLTRNQGEDAMAFYGRSALARNEYRVALEQYNEVRRQVNELPTDFDIRAPRRIWALYDMLIFERELKVTGTAEPDWRISIDTLNTLREMAQPALLPDGKPGSNHIAALVTLGRDAHPYNQRLVAYAMSLSGALSQMNFNDQLYQLSAAMLKGSDTTARRVVIKELASVFPPNTATMTLLKNVAAADLDPRSRMETLRGMLQSDFSPTSPTARDAVASLNQALSNPQGPEPREVLEQVLENTRDNPDAIAMLAGGIRFSDLPADRLDDAIVFTVENASTHPLAARWLNEQFLGAINPDLVQQTFEVIATANAGGKSLAPAVGTGMSMLFGKPAKPQGQQEATARAQLSQPIAILGTNHAIFRAIRSSDPRIKQLAWQALPNFVFAPVAPNATEFEIQSAMARYETLLDIALQQNPTPTAAVSFIAQQPDRARAAAALVQIVLRGSSNASALASRELMRMNTPLGGVLGALPFGERATLAMRMYENLVGRAPLTTGLLRQRLPNNPLVTWFAEHLTQGRLPAPAQWADAYTNEADLLALITSSDPDVGQAATAALVYRAGGSDRDAIALARSLRGLPDQSAANIATQWNKAKQEIYLKQFAAIAGPYKLILIDEQQQQHMLAVVQFQSDGSNISFGNQAIALSIPGDRLAVRIDKPAELKSLSNTPALANLSLDSVPAIELTRVEQGLWEGSINIPGLDPAPKLRMESVIR